MEALLARMIAPPITIFLATAFWATAFWPSGSGQPAPAPIFLHFFR